MTKLFFRTPLAALLLSASLAAAPAAVAHEVKAGALTIEQPWARATPPGARVGGGYVRIENAGAEADRLIGGAAEFARRVEIHEMAMDGDVMRMRPLTEGLDIPAGGSVTLKPGGYHIMFMGLDEGLVEGSRLPVTLTFEKAGDVIVDFAVEAIGHRPKDAGGMDHSGHGDHSGLGAARQ